MITKEQIPLVKEGESKAMHDFDALLLSCDVPSLPSAVSAWARLTGQHQVTPEFTVDDFYELTCQCLADLILRGAISPVRPLSTEGEKQLRFLKTVYGQRPAEQASVAQEDPDARFREVAEMHKTLSSAELKAWLNEVPERWELHEEAAIRGLI